MQGTTDGGSQKFGRPEGCPSTELARSHGISQSCIYEFVARHAGGSEIPRQG